MQNHVQDLMLESLTVAFSATDEAPRVVVDNGKILLTAWSEGVIEIVTEPRRLLPSIRRISQKHAKKVTTAGFAIGAVVCLTRMHNAQVVDKLNIALPAVKLGAEALCKLANSMHSMHLLRSDDRHTRITLDQWRTQKRGFDQLAHGSTL
jgi:hypothetical protein